MHRFLLSTLFLATALPVCAQQISVVNAGGGTATSSEHRLQATVGSFALGTLASDEHVVRGGFWPQVHPPAGPIAVPVTAQDDVATDEDAALTIQPLDNDTDPAGGSLTITSFTQPPNGTVEETGVGELTYTPSPNFNGPDSFSYTAANEIGGSAAAEVIVTVAPVNDAPAFDSEPVTGAAAGEAYSYVVAATDIDGDALTLSGPTLPAWLSFTDDGEGNGTLEGTPTNAEAGEHEVVIAAADAEATVEQAFVITVVIGIPAPPALTAPADGSTDVARDVTLDWTDVVGAATYDIQLATTNDFSVVPLDSAGITTSAFEVANLSPSTQYYWRVRAVNGAGESAYAGPFSFTTISNVAAEAAELPDQYRLHQNYPNPFNPSTTIPFDLPASGDVRIVVYDLFGREVTTAVDARYAAGSHRVQLNLGGIASGSYFYRIEAGVFRAVRRMIILK